MAATTTWEKVKRNLPIGRQLKDGTYIVAEHLATAIVVKRQASGSTVRGTRSKCESTIATLADGPIERRKISYTTAEEFCIVTALGRDIKEGTAEFSGKIKKCYLAG